MLQQLVQRKNLFAVAGTDYGLRDHLIRLCYTHCVNNVVAFPGIFKGALEGRATQITEEMKLAAANAIANLVPENELSEDNIMPEAFNPKVANVVAEAVKSHIER